VLANHPTLRLAAPHEREALEALQWRASLNNPGDRDALLANPDAVAVPADQIARNQVVVAEIGGAIVGFAAVLPRSDGQAELDALFVDPAIWKSGIGRALVEECAKMARSQGSAFLHVIGNPHAEGFYTNCGFERAGTTGTRFGEGLLMRKAL